VIQNRYTGTGTDQNGKVPELINFAHQLPVHQNKLRGKVKSGASVKSEIEVSHKIQEINYFRQLPGDFSGKLNLMLL
jgi:hypothetical protein